MAWCSNTGLQAIVVFLLEKRFNYSDCFTHPLQNLAGVLYCLSEEVELLQWRLLHAFASFRMTPYEYLVPPASFVHLSASTNQCILKCVSLKILKMYYCYSSSQLVILTLSGSDLAKWQKKNTEVTISPSRSLTSQFSKLCAWTIQFLVLCLTF